MIIDTPSIRAQLPTEYGSAYPRFILFMEKYYEWLYRGSGLSDKEIEILKSDTSWLQADIDKFISSGDVKYVDTTQIDELEQIILELSNVKNPGYQAKHLQDNYMLEDDAGDFNTSDGSTFVTADDASFEIPVIDQMSVDNWFSAFGIPEFSTKSNIIAGVDKSLLVSLMKHIYAIKGTEMAMKLFFNLCFGENITIYQPKQNIAVIDGNWVLDDIFVIRDDELYQEYSYVIVVKNDISEYQEAFDAIYRLLIHPAGFRVVMVKESDFAPGTLF